MLFIDNKYSRWYNNIIANARSRPILIENYTEKHHVMPKSLGGNKSKNNLVALSAREHFICHWLLTKMTTGTNKRKMVFAFHSMAMKNDSTKLRYLNSQAYSKNKLALSKFKSIIMKENNPMSNLLIKEKHKSAIKKRGPTKGTTGFLHTEATKEKMKQAQKGKTLSNETKEKLRVYNTKLWEQRRANGNDKRKPLSEETKRKISETLKRKNSTYT